MNAHVPMTEGNALALPANLGDLVAGRDRAIEIWSASYDDYHRSAALAAAASVGGNMTLTAPYGDRRSGESMTRLFLKSGESRHYDRDLRRDKISDARSDFVAELTQSVDRKCWFSLMQTLGFDTLLDRQAREEFNTSLENEPPAFTVDNIRATFGTIWGSRRDIYLRGIANVFMAMDRRFRSHDAFAIGNRLIIEFAFSAYGAHWESYNRRDTLDDVERIFRELDGLPPLAQGQKVSSRVEQHRRDSGGSGRYEDDLFKIDHYLNRNVHFWFKRKDLLAKVNELLLEYYKPVEGDVGDGPSYETGPLFHASPAKRFGEFFTSEAVTEIVMERLELSTTRYDGDKREHYEIVPTVLEPSAGGGILAAAARKAGASVQCVEIQPNLVDDLRRRGVSCRNGDFLRMTPAELGLFDYVVMNPPFDRGRDCDHVRHALTFLKPGGTLIAIMSARAEFGSDARHNALHELIKTHADDRRPWRDLPERSFAHAGTNVNTVTLLLKKPWR